MTSQKQSTSMMGRAVSELAKRDTWTTLELQQIVSRVCGTKGQAVALTSQLMKNGYIDRVVIVTPLAKERAQA